MSSILNKSQLFTATGNMLGNALTMEKDTPGKVGKFQEYEKGLIFYHPSFSAVVLTENILKKWKSASVANTTAHNGQTVQAYLGFPVADTGKTSDGTEVCIFERGIIICRPNGASYVVYGAISDKYLASQKRGIVTTLPTWMGFPTADTVIGARNALIGRFEHADIYSKNGDGPAFEVHGAIRDRYNVGHVTSELGHPTSDERDVFKNFVSIGKQSLFEGGAIYWSSATGAWEVRGALWRSYMFEWKGPAGELGFPKSGETKSPTDQYRFNNFEHGVLAWKKPSGPVLNVSKLALRVTSITTNNKADSTVFPFGSSPDDPYLRIKVGASIPVLGLKPEYHLPSSNNGREGIDTGTGGVLYYLDTNNILVQENNQTVCTIPINDGNQQITVSIETWDYDSGGNTDDDLMARCSGTYDIDTLWDTTQQIARDRNPRALEDNWVDEDGEVKARIAFNLTPSFKINVFDSVEFRRTLWWNIHNYRVDHLSRKTYAETFSDVNEDEFFLFSPFNAIFFEAVYKSLAGPGICFGMCAEAIYALKNQSISNQPIGLYSRDLSNNDRPDSIRDREFQIRHGYQLSGGLVRYYMSQFVSGEVWDPVLSFHRSKEMFDRGDYPVMVMSKSATGFSDGGHAVLPYHWDASDPKKLILWIANPNLPVYQSGEGDEVHLAPQNIITIYNDGSRVEFEFQNNIADVWKGGKGTFNGGRMFPIPYSKFSTVPRTPFVEIGVALLAVAPLAAAASAVIFLPPDFLSGLLGGALFICGGSAEVGQVTDGQDHRYFENDGSVIYDPDRKIDSFMHVPGIGGGAIASRPKYFAVQRPDVEDPIYSPNAVDTALEHDRWNYSQLATAAMSKEFWPSVNPGNAPQQFSDAVRDGVVQMLEKIDLRRSLAYDMQNTGDGNYFWSLMTRHAKYQMEANATPDTTDRVSIDGLNTAGQAVTFGTADAVQEKRFKATVTSANNLVTFLVDGATVVPGSPVAVQMSDGGKKLFVYNHSNPTSAHVSMRYGLKQDSAVRLGQVDFAADSITTFEMLSPTTVKREIYDKLGGDPISSVSFGNISLDCTALSHMWLTLLPQTPGPTEPSPSTNPLADHPDSGGWFYCKNRTVDFVLTDGTYDVTVQSGTNSMVSFTVKDGIISYHPELEGIVEGAGTNRLVLKGVPVSIDTTAADNDLVYLPGVNSLAGDEFVNLAKTTFQGNLLPTCHDINDGWEYGFMIGSGVAGRFTFKLLLDGTITYRDQFDADVTGRGTNSLKITRFVPL